MHIKECLWFAAYELFWMVLMNHVWLVCVMLWCCFSMLDYGMYSLMYHVSDEVCVVVCRSVAGLA